MNSKLESPNNGSDMSPDMPEGRVVFFGSSIIYQVYEMLRIEREMNTTINHPTQM